MPALELPRTALKYRNLSSAAATRAAREARRARPRGTDAVLEVLARHQVAQARYAADATAAVLATQGIRTPPDAPLLAAGFTTGRSNLSGMLDAVETDWQFSQLVASLVQDAGRAAQSVSQASRPRVGWTRTLTPPSCSRCAVLAGRVYRYSTGFLRHPRDDCTMIPSAEGDDRYVADIGAMTRAGQITGLSKADHAALGDGADLAQLVNVRRQTAGLQTAGRALVRQGRPTPEGIYRMASDREAALTLLARYRYIAS